MYVHLVKKERKRDGRIIGRQAERGVSGALPVNLFHCKVAARFNGCALDRWNVPHRQPGTAGLQCARADDMEMMAELYKAV